MTDTAVYSIGVGVSVSFADSVFADVLEEDVVFESEFPPTAPITPTATTAKTTHLSFQPFFLPIELLLLIALFTTFRTFYADYVFCTADFAILCKVRLFVVFLFYHFENVL